MNHHALGASGLKVSALWLGTMMFGDRTDEAEAARIVGSAREAGVNAIDTANMYAGGESERITGRLIQADRAHWVLASKVANATGPGRGAGKETNAEQAVKGRHRRAASRGLNFRGLRIHSDVRGSTGEAQ